MTTPRIDPGSFRDRDGRVFRSRGKIYRALSEQGLADWQTAEKSPFLQRELNRGGVIATRPAELEPGVLDELPGPWVAAVEHELVPFLSYAYEWPFGMLREAALLTLRMVRGALADDLMLKDATPYNVQWRGAEPVFIDIGSFEPRQPGDPWPGYLQFCQLFLYPLLLTAYRDVPFQPWLRGSLEGILPTEADRLFSSWRDRLRPGVFRDVYLHAKLQNSSADTDRQVRGDIRRAGFGKELIAANLRRLEKIAGSLTWRHSATTWGDYADGHSYQADDRAAKETFVRRVAASRRWPLVWDLGSNTGDFSRLVAEHADTVVAMDADPLAVERMYQRLRDEGPGNILPLQMNVADPSPDLGWAQQERGSAITRGTPDLTLCLALIHHLVITHHVPVGDVLDWLRGLDSHLVIEFVTREDAMVQRLLRNRPDIYHDYHLESFEQQLARRFEIEDTVVVLDGTRKLFSARPR